MYFKLDDKQLELVKAVQEITLTDYELEGNFLPADSLLCMIEDLKINFDACDEAREDVERKYDDACQSLPKEREYGEDYGLYI